jgi:hypothetical protein
VRELAASLFSETEFEPAIRIGSFTKRLELVCRHLTHGRQLFPNPFVALDIRLDTSSSTTGMTPSSAAEANSFLKPGAISVGAEIGEEIKHQDGFFSQNCGDGTISDPLGQAIDDCLLSDPRLADQHRVLPAEAGKGWIIRSGSFSRPTKGPSSPFIGAISHPSQTR